MIRLLSLALLLPGRAWSHVDPIYPVELSLRAYDDQALVRVVVPAALWKEDILGDVPGSAWPEPLRLKAKDYLAKQFSLALDGRPLALELIGSRLVEEPWDGAEGGHLIFDLRYSFPGGGGHELTGRSAFYGDFWRPLKERSAAVPQDFVTFIDVQGARPKRLTVIYEQPDFKIPFEDARRTAGQRVLENMLAGASWLWREPAAFLFFAGAVLFLPARDAGLRALLIFAAGLTLCYWPGPAVSGPAAQAAPWLGPAFVCAAAGARFGAKFWTAAVAGSAVLLGLSLHRWSLDPLLATPTLPTRLFFLLGAAAAGAACALAVWAGIRAYADSLKKESESLAGALLSAHLRFLGTGLCAVCVYRFILALRSAP